MFQQDMVHIRPPSFSGGTIRLPSTN